MELTLGRRADYGIRATLDLARHHGGELRKARQISTAMEIPASILPQILAELVRAGIATSTAGPRGGYGMARDPADVSLLDVIVAADGQLPVDGNCVLRSGPCRWDDVCAVHVPWSRAKQAMLDDLGASTFADIGELDAALEKSTFAATEVTMPGQAPTTPAAPTS